MTTPVIGLTADVKQIDPHPYHCVGDKYVRAVADMAGATPVVLPALQSADVDPLLDLLDGLLLTGSYANIHPSHYGGGDPYAGSPTDRARDETNLALIPRAIARGLPVLGVCRGLQEINVALGGTLHQQLGRVPGLANHQEDDSRPLDEQYGLAHTVDLVPGGVLSTLADELTQQVNSLHGQGIDRLALGLTVEARSPDGLVEAFRIEAASDFGLAVQWHPEWKPQQFPFYSALWRAFGTACRRHAIRRGRQSAVA